MMYNVTSVMELEELRQKNQKEIEKEERNRMVNDFKIDIHPVVPFSARVFILILLYF